jgi:ribosomal protein L16 Arg81 hydroxylase
MRDAQAFIFVSSPGSITPYHMDPEHNFLLQIRGSKEVRLFERSVVGEEELERFHTAGGHRNLAFREEYHARSLACELIPGRGLHFPVHAPHYVRNGPDVSISFSITFRTPDLERLVRTHQFNAWLRRRGVPPAPVGQHPGRDRLKSLALRVARKLSRFG